MIKEREVRVRVTVYENGAYYVEVVEGASVCLSMQSDRAPVSGGPEIQVVQQAVLRSIGLAR